mmetsp:Transcript_30504/g.60358  ORF Transcript_30504/g.60358 Transcript_30504/m.60358 type:complete len:113 (-) Transcript_30504:308-646(-)
MSLLSLKDSQLLSRGCTYKDIAIEMISSDIMSKMVATRSDLHSEQEKKWTDHVYLCSQWCYCPKMYLWIDTTLSLCPSQAPGQAPRAVRCLLNLQPGLLPVGPSAFSSSAAR